ncbi:protein SRC2-like [Salvia miltiorrhiza]|uniref:protein SRC2-like n=1 Tax=Salvia miltiorrhiza TaxID=226208 RepID=UPI0025AD4ED5|nr:protein SRC2-like [Salvia miltiorrhiza]
MECRTFEITLISANNLEKLTRLLRMKVYAKVSIGGTTEIHKRTPTDRHGGSNPAWNFTVKYTLNEPMVQHYANMLVVKLFSRRRLACDRYVGEVHTSLKELFDIAAPNGGSAILTFPVQIGSISSQGAVRFSYRFGEKVTIDKMLLAERVAGWSQC